MFSILYHTIGKLTKVYDYFIFIINVVFPALKQPKNNTFVILHGFLGYFEPIFNFVYEMVYDILNYYMKI